MTTPAPARWPGPAAAGVLLVWYALTMARDLVWFDSGELALVGAQLGLGHPPGQPLYTVILHGFSRLPGLDPLVGMNLLSALCAAACALPADALLRRAVGLSAWPRLLALLAVGGLAPVWDQATRIELYALATLLVLTLVAAGHRTILGGGGGALAWLGLGALAGLAAGVNPVFALGGALGVGVAALPVLKPRRRLGVAVGAAALGAVAMVGLCYLYVWQVRDRTDTLVWGPLETGGDWLRYLAGADYAGTEHGAWGKAPGHLVDWATWLVGQGALPVVMLGVAGWTVATGLRRHLALWAIPFLVGAAFTFTYGTFYPEIPDYNGYQMPALWLGAMGLGGLLRWVQPRRATALGAVLLVSVLVTGERPVWARSRAGIDLPRTLATAWLTAAPPRALLLVESDHLVFPLMYLQAVERQRPDVVVLNVGFANSSWYWRWLFASHPDLPRIALAAPSVPERLRRLIDAAGRPVMAETVAWAFHLRMAPCAATWGFALGVDCATVRDDAPAFHDQLRAALNGAEGEDPISFRVVALLGAQRAEGLWFLGDASLALQALRAGIPEGERLPVPPDLRRPAAAGPLAGPPILLGHPERNRAFGVQVLEQLDREDDAARWRRGG
ncbi:MAG: DUF2723 domain-containing protein [Myxococcales bacterium]|nr:DUF2723 domain-containing protein [Myxococcales bacterium]